MRYVAIVASAISMSGAMSRASVAVVGTQISDTPLAFSESGTFLAAGNFNGSTDLRGTNVFQGVTLASSTSPATWSTNGLSIAVAASANGSLASATLPTPSDDLYLTEIYAPNQLTMSLTISGLNPALRYLIQFPHGENRAVLYSNSQTFSDSKNNSAIAPLAFGDLTTTPNGQKFSLTTINVSGSTSLTYDMPPSASPGTRGPSFDGFSVRVVPEPSNFFVLVCVAPLLCCRQRYRGDLSWWRGAES